MLNKYPLLFRFFYFFIVPIFSLLLFLFFYLKSSVAPEEGMFEVDGLSYPVEITHDQYGVPKIDAKTDRDAYFSIGFKHASDRLWQLEMQRRLSQGRLSEVLGADALSKDIWIRTLGLSDAAWQSMSYLDKKTIDVLTAYSQGINAWVEQAPSLPIEFQIFGIKPEPWSVYDSLCWLKVLSLSFGGNMHEEMQRYLLKKHLTPEQMKYLYPYDSASDYTETIESKKNYLMAQRDVLTSFGIGHKYTGSNAWVVSGKHTVSGRPILANDPHLGLQLPTLWYATALKGDELDVSGMTYVGLPMIMSGQNSDIAWGFTNLMSDQQDLFIESVSPDDPSKYRNGNEWVKFKTRSEKINVATRFPSFLHEPLKPVEIQIRETERGPVVSDSGFGGNGRVISLRWVALDSEDHTIDSYLQIQYAKDWSEFRNALMRVKSPGLNFVYADRAGNIGYQAAGMLPKRGEGSGTLPMMAKQGSDWLGYYDFNLLPSILNPDTGFIVSANEKLKHSPEIVISHDWAPSTRHERITHLLKQSINSRELMSMDDMREIQSDSVDLSALALLPFFRAYEAESNQAKEVVAVLNEWNGEFDSESVGATIFAVWSYYLREEIFKKAMSNSSQNLNRSELFESLKNEVGWSKLVKIVATNDHGACVEYQAEVCSLELQRSFVKALKQIEKISGTKTVSKWRWSEMAQAEFLYQPFGQINGIKSLFNRTTHAVASPDSVNASNHIFDPFKGFTQTFGAGFRQVFDLDDKASHWYMLSTGQSSNIMSSHFDDMISPFANHQLTRFNHSEQSKKHITLVPRSGY